jgi:phosphatidylglycerol:prolipoprotein diacylglycerol transferase
VRSTLFFIPHVDPWFNWPVFGFGWLLAIWAAVGLIWLVWSARTEDWKQQVLSHLPMWLIIGAAIAWFSPMLEEATAEGVVLGLPIRGYGTMVMLGVIAGVGLVVRLGQRNGIDPDTFFSMAFWVFIAGIAGARVFYVIEYWQEFQQPTLGATISEVMKFTKGGLVVYGALIGAVVAGVLFLRKRRLPMLAIADIVAPGLALGQALGRIGCLMHGCCWGGLCDDSQLGIEFPIGSPPYVAQLENGSIVGMRLVKTDRKDALAVAQVAAGSLAEQQGVRPGDKIIGISIPTVDEFREYRENPGPMIARVLYTTDDMRRVSWDLHNLRPRSQPVYPTQIFSSLNAALICVFLCLYFPFRFRDGAVIAWMLTVYPITRFLLEMIRADEAGVLSTGLTISQWISIFVLVGAIGLWAYLIAHPRPLAFGQAKTRPDPS